MPQLKYRFHGLEPNRPIARIEKLADFQIFGRPKGIHFPADEKDCQDILDDAVWHERNGIDAHNSANNKMEMTKALQAIEAFKRAHGLLAGAGCRRRFSS